MKVLHATKYFHPHRGGIENHIENLAAGMPNVDLSVCTSNPGEYKGIKLYRSTSIFEAYNAPLIPGMFLDLMTHDHDLIHFHHPDPFTSIFVYAASVLRNKPIIITYHSDIVDKPGTGVYSVFLRILLNRAKRIVATTSVYIEKSSLLGKYREKIEVIHNPVDTKRYVPAESSFKEEIPGRMVLFLGRLVPYKGVSSLITAFEKVHVKATLVIAGSGPLKEELMEQAKKTGKDIRFVSVDEVGALNLYNACDVFVLPSVTKAEAFGVVLLEAMSCAKPVIGTNVGGVPDVVANDRFIVEPHDTISLADRITWLLINPGEAQILGAKNRRRMIEEFDVEVVAKKMRLLYGDCVGDNKDKE